MYVKCFVGKDDVSLSEWEMTDRRWKGIRGQGKDSGQTMIHNKTAKNVCGCSCEASPDKTRETTERKRRRRRGFMTAVL